MAGTILVTGGGDIGSQMLKALRQAGVRPGVPEPHRAAPGWPPRVADLHTIVAHAWACWQWIAAVLDHARPASDRNRSS